MLGKSVSSSFVFEERLWSYTAKNLTVLFTTPIIIHTYLSRFITLNFPSSFKFDQWFWSNNNLWKLHDFLTLLCFSFSHKPTFFIISAWKFSLSPRWNLVYIFFVLRVLTILWYNVYAICAHCFWFCYFSYLVDEKIHPSDWIVCETTDTFRHHNKQILKRIRNGLLYKNTTFQQNIAP